MKIVDKLGIQGVENAVKSVLGIFSAHNKNNCRNPSLGIQNFK